MNKERLLELADIIEKVPPQAFDMADWLLTNDKAPCGTAACIAGHACLHFIIGDDKKGRQEAITKGMIYLEGYWRNVSMSARTILELTDWEAQKLFFVGNWPVRWVDAYNGPDDSDPAKNKAAADYIREFVRTDGYREVEEDNEPLEEEEI